MSHVVRFDRVELPPKAEITAEGYIRGEAVLTRSGIFEYKLPDGSVRREYRPAEEVFAPESLRSFGLVPITVGHPRTVRADGQPLLDAGNAAPHTVGMTGESVRQDGDFMRAPIVIHDRKAVEQVKAGKRALSNGYSARLDFTPGVFNGVPYEAVQREIRGNHVSIVDVGRAGSVAAIRLDGNQIDEGDDMSERNLSTIKLDGIDYKAEPEVLNALTKAQGEREKLQGQLDSATSALKTKTDEADAAKAKLDSATSELETLKKADRTTEIRDAVKARVALEKVAGRVLPSETKIDEMDDQAIRKAVIAAKEPQAKLDGQSDVYIQARFDSVVEKLGADKSAIARQREQSTVRADAGDEKPLTQDEARKALMERNRNAWRGNDNKAA